MDQSLTDVSPGPDNVKLSNAIAHESNQQCTNHADGNELKFPQRVDQLDCQYFLRTGDCKFGVACRYHHPCERGGSLQKETQGEKVCAYYTRTGSCKFGSDCRFHHAQAEAASVKSLPSSLVHVFHPYPALDHTPYNGTVPVWYMANPYFPSNYMPMFVPPAWIPYKGPMSPDANFEEEERSRKSASNVLSTSMQNTDDTDSKSNESSPAVTPRGVDFFPEREGEPECQYYLKTGGCKFGALCKFHHPRDRAGTPRSGHLNVLGLPLRPGQPDCSFYLRHRICKYGRVCKFNHPEVVSIYDTWPSPMVPMIQSPNIAMRPSFLLHSSEMQEAHDTSSLVAHNVIN